jgi:hypothetical protein
MNYFFENDKLIQSRTFLKMPSVAQKYKKLTTSLEVLLHCPQKLTTGVCSAPDQFCPQGFCLEFMAISHICSGLPN